MTVLWIIVELLFIVFFFQLPRVEKEDESPAVESHTSKGSSTVALQKDAKSINKDECAPLMHKETSPSDKAYGTTSSPTQRISISNSVAVVTSTGSMMEPVVKEENGCLALLLKFHRKCAYLLNSMLREEIVYLLGVLFVTMFNQTAIEVSNCTFCLPLIYLFLSVQTMFVPLAENLLKWEERQISFFYSGAGVEVGKVVVLASVPLRDYHSY